MNKRKIGAEQEARAAEYLQQQGYVIRERNYHSRLGEIDIIAVEGEYLCFVEVKYRSNRNFGSAMEAVDHRKQCRIRSVAQYYLMKNGYNEWTPCRFDVVAIEGERMTLLRNAFEG